MIAKSQYIRCDTINIHVRTTCSDSAMVLASAIQMAITQNEPYRMDCAAENESYYRPTVRHGKTTANYRM